MERLFWQKQGLGEPLFGDILWNKPENRQQAGKLLIVGGNSHLIAAPGQAYSAAQDAGIGSIRLLLPDAVQKTLGKLVPEAEFAPSTPSGSFGRKALAQFLENAEWADGVLLAGDFGRNSETEILLESFAQKHKSQLTVAQDSLDYFLAKKSMFFSRESTLIVINSGKLQKLAMNNRPRWPITHSLNLHQLVEILSDWTSQTKIQLITNHDGQFVAACDGKVSTTPMPKSSNWQVELASYAAVWWLQQPKKTFEALTTAVFGYISS